MRSLNSNTLEDISRYSDKTFKLINYLSQSEQPLVINNLSKISQTPDEVELIEAFAKDVNETVNMFAKAYTLLSVVDNEDRVLQLKGPSSDLKEVFGDYYNPAKKSINIGGIELGLKTTFSKEKIKDSILKEIVGIGEVEFSRLFKKRKTIYKLNEDSLANDEERIEFLSIVKEQEDHKNVINKIKFLHEGFMVLRASFTEEDKRKIDTEITFNRSMIDSVTKLSTYFNKDEGYVQISSGHKKQKELLNKLQRKIENSHYVKAVELDKDSSLEAVIDVVDQINKMNFNLGNEVFFKVRKLGNYNANGLYVDSQKLVAVDISEPSALIHEFTHSIDFSNLDMKNSKNRNEIIKRYKAKINREGLPGGKESYYMSGNEVIARLGEMAYLFDKFKKEETESMDEFINRVRVEEVQKDAYNLSMIKPIDYYVGESTKNIYFNLREWSEEDIRICRSFYGTFFNVDNKPLKDITPVPIFHEEKPEAKRREIKRYEKTAVSLFDYKNIKFALDYNKKHNVVEFSKLIKEIMRNPTKLCRTTKKYDNIIFREQIATMNNLSEWVKEQNNPYLDYQVYKNYLHMCSTSISDVGYYTFKAIKDDKHSYLDGESFLEYENKEVNKIQKELDVLHQKQDTESISDSFRLMGKRRQMLGYARRKYDNIIKQLYPEIIEMDKERKESIRIDGKGILNRGSIIKMYKETIKNLSLSFQEKGLDNVLAFGEKDDEVLERTLLAARLRNSMMSLGYTKIEKDLQKVGPVMKYLGVLENMENPNPFSEESKVSMVVGEDGSRYSVFQKYITKSFTLKDMYKPCFDFGSLSNEDFIKQINNIEDKTEYFDNIVKEYNLDNPNKAIEKQYKEEVAKKLKEKEKKSELDVEENKNNKNKNKEKKQLNLF